MKRPLGLIGFFYFAGLVFATRLGLNFAVAMGVFLLLAGGGALFVSKLRATGVIPAALFSCSAACLMAALAFPLSVAPVQALCQKQLPVRAMIVSDAEDYGSYFIYTAQMTTVEEPEQSFRARLSVDQPLDCEAYDYADMTVTLYPISADYQSGWFPDGIYVTAYPSGEITIHENENKPFSYTLYLARQKVNQTVNEYLSPPLSSVVTGVTLGGGADIGVELYGQIRTAGVTHMFAVSGMHIVIFGQMVVLMLTFLGVRRRRAPAYALIVVWLFIGICGFPFSSLRAGIMFSIYALGLVIFEQADAINSLGISLLLICLPNPLSAMDVGLLLSAAATLGILLLSRPITDFLSRFVPKNHWMASFLRAAYNLIAVSASASLFTLPILILAFGQLSTYSLLTNLLLFFAPNIILVCTPLATLFSMLHLDFLASPLMFAGGLAAKYMILCVRFVSGLPYAFLPAEDNYLLLALAFCLVLIALWLLLSPGNRRLLRLVAVCCVVLLATGAISHAIFERGVARIYLMEDSEGISALVLQDGHAALIGCGSEENAALRQFLSSKMIGRLDAVVFPSLDDTYAGGAGRILDSQKCESVFAPESGTYRSEVECRLDAATLHNLPLESTPLWEGVSVRQDASSGALMLRIGEGEVAFLVPGLDQTSQPLSYCIAVAPAGLTTPPAQTVLLTTEDSGTAATLAAQGAAVYMASQDGALCIASRGGSSMTIRRE